MPTPPAPDYFDTPEWTEREHLLAHLVASSRELLYLRAPSGGGKTRFTVHLLERLAEQRAVVWLHPADFASAHQAVVAEPALSAAPGEWRALLQQDRSALLVVDNADALVPAEMAQLLEAHTAGARLLLIGVGRLTPPPGDSWPRVHFVDLPPFTEAQSVAFMLALGTAQLASLGEAGARKLHAAARGLPGPILEALAGIPPAPPGSVSRLKNAGIPRPWYLAGGAMVLILAVGLLFHHDLKALFRSPTQPQQAAARPSATPSPAQLAGTGSRPSPATVLRPPTPGADLSGSANPGPAVATDAAPPRRVAGAVAESLTTKPAGARVPAVSDALIDAAIKAAAQPGAAASPSAGPVPVAKTNNAPRAPQGVPQRVSVQARRLAAVLSPRTPTAGAATPAHAIGQGLSWLRAQPPGNYTLQLVAARDRASLDRFVARHAVPQPYAVFERRLNGRPWYSLVSGSYRDHAAAVAARVGTAARFASAAWPRTFDSIFRQLDR